MAPILEIKGVEKRFAGLKALSNVNIEIEEGEIFGLIGPNGSGKTTLLNIITGFLKPTTGSILYKGKPITGLSPNLIAERRIARTFQLISVFPDLTAEESIIVGSHLRTNGTIWGSFFHSRGYQKRRPD
ncbi:MAG: ATP-binding cassette domain-containing protein [Dehalococcoidia bacterium]|nr:ATP-binding cassette domain-containing protein [Dehalococcoidia bacterium]